MLLDQLSVCNFYGFRFGGTLTGILVYHFFVMLYISKLGGVGQEKNLKDCWVGPGKFIDVDRVGKNFFLDFGSFSSVPPPAINNDL